MSISVVCPEGHPVLVAASRLGTVAHCPRCLAAFLIEMNVAPAWHARKEESKKKRARDDDDDEEGDEDDDEEDERPRKKAKAKRSDEDEEDEDDDKPRRKKQSRRGDDDDDEDEEEEEEEEGEPQAPIRLNRLQRRLTMVHLGMTFILVAVIATTLLPLLSFLMGLFQAVLGWVDENEFLPWLCSLVLTLVRFSICAAIVVGLIFGFWTPPRAETRGTIIGAIICAALMVFFTLFMYLGYGNLIMGDHLRNRNFGDLFLYFANTCQFLFFLMTMIYLKQLTSYLRDMLLASEPITIMVEFTLWFVIPQIIRSVLVASLDYKKIDMFTYMLLGAFGLFLLGSIIRAYFLLWRWVFVVIKIRDLVAKAIVDA